MSDQHTFDTQSVKRIGRAVKTVEAGIGMLPRRERKHRRGIGPQPKIISGNAVVIRAIPEGGDYGTVLHVQRITLTEAGTWAATGEMIEMPTFPLMPAIYWQHFVVPEGSAPEFSGQIQPTRTIGGVECVDLFVPLFAVERGSDDPHRGPRPV